MLYLVSPKDSDLVDSEPMSESDVIDYTASITGKIPEDFNDAVIILDKNGYSVYLA